MEDHQLGSSGPFTWQTKTAVLIILSYYTGSFNASDGDEFVCPFSIFLVIARPSTSCKPWRFDANDSQHASCHNQSGRYGGRHIYYKCIVERIIWIRMQRWTSHEVLVWGRLGTRSFLGLRDRRRLDAPITSPVIRVYKWLTYDQRTDSEESNEVPCHAISAGAAGSSCWIDSSKMSYFYAVLSPVSFLDTNLLDSKNFQVFSELMTTCQRSPILSNPRIHASWAVATIGVGYQKLVLDLNALLMRSLPSSSIQ